MRISQKTINEIFDAAIIEDVIAGAAIGILSSFYFTKKHNKTIIYPQFNNEYFGLEIIYKY